MAARASIGIGQENVFGAAGSRWIELLRCMAWLAVAGGTLAAAPADDRRTRNGWG